MAGREWEGRSALVTGAGTGIGRALSIELARRGARVYVSALTLPEAQQVVDQITADGGQAHPLALDVTDNTAYRSAIDRVVADCGGIDLLVNNAGVLYVGEFYEMDEEFLEHLVRVNFTAVAIGTLYGYRAMRERGRGLIVNIASQAGVMPVGTMAAYAGTKHGVFGLTASVAGEAAASGVALKAVCPGNVASELLRGATTRGTDARGVLDVLPKAMPTDRAARIIVDGFARPARVIFVPKSVRVFDWLQRLSRGFGHRGVLHSMQQFRVRRDDTRSQH